jgi:hypothetical protein
MYVMRTVNVVAIVLATHRLCSVCSFRPRTTRKSWSLRNVLSATMKTNMLSRRLLAFCESIGKCECSVKREQQVLDTIRQFYVYCETREAKFEAIHNLYDAITIGQAMIFCHVRLIHKRCVVQENNFTDSRRI